MNKSLAFAKLSILLMTSPVLAQDWAECSLNSENIGSLIIDDEDRAAVSIRLRKPAAEPLNGKLVCQGYGGRVLEGEVKDSRLHGKVYDYDRAGSKNYKLTQFKNGVMSTREFYGDGELAKRITYDGGKLYDETSFQKDGSKTYRACPKSTDYCSGLGSIRENPDGRVTSYECDQKEIGNKRIDKFCGFNGPSKVELYGREKNAGKEQEHTLVRGQPVGSTTWFNRNGKVSSVRAIDSEAAVHYNEEGKIATLRCPEKATDEMPFKKLCGFGAISPQVELVGYDRTTRERRLNGRLHGDYTEHWKNGKLKTQVKLENGLAEGEKRELTAEGKLVSVSFFQKATRPYRPGQEFQVQNGWVKHYNADETMISEEVLADCRPQKVSKFYDNGKLKVVTAYFHEELKPREEISHYRDDGRLLVTMSLVAQKVVGPVKWLHPDGKTIASLDTYDDGRLISRKRFDERGEVTCLDDFLPDGSRKDPSAKSCGGKVPFIKELAQLDLLPQPQQQPNGGTSPVPPSPPSLFEED